MLAKASLRQSLYLAGMCCLQDFTVKMFGNQNNMNLLQALRWESLVKLHPIPWYLDQSNDSGVCVKDNHGEVVFYDDFGSIPDEMSSGTAEKIKCRSTTLALWLVAYSENPFDN